MRKFFTRLLMMVFLVSVMFHVYAAGPPVADPLPAGVTLLLPEDGSTTQALPGTDNVFVLKFTKDLHETAYFGAQGVIALSGYASQGIWQVDPILLGNDGGGGKVEKKGPREVHISFNSSLLEDSTYHITIEDDAIRFADGTWFGGVVPMQWNFTVKDVTPPQMVTCDDANNVNGLFNVSLTQDPIAVCFSEPVWWAAGADPMKIGNIAFYTAAKAGLDPNDEFGGDVIYEKPKHVILYNNGMEVSNSLELKAASIVVPIEFDKVEIWLKDEPENGSHLQLKHAAIGNNVWPVDRDIYLRFAAGLLVDKGGNEFAGINGSPFDPYDVSSTKYWFSTRLTDEIPTSARAVWNTSTLPGITRSGALWSNDDIVVEISNGNLEIIPNTAITTLTVKQFIKLSIDGIDRDYTVKLISVAGNTTSFLIEPGTLPEKKQLKVDLLGDKIHDKGDLRVVEANSWTFNTGDYTPPVITASVNNILCTNFDLRVNTDENGVVFYAVVKEPVPTHWDAATVTPLDVVRGYRDVVVGSTTHRYYFYHVDDDVSEYGAATSTTIDDYEEDYFNITPSLTAFEKVLNFTEENHGDKYRIYYFAHDPNAQGPYNNPAGTPDGRVTAVSNLPVQLTDCLKPEIAWFFEGVNTTNDPVFDACEDEEYIKKQGKWKLDFTANVEGLYLEFAGETWDDVIILEVSTDGVNYDVVERTIVPIMSGDKVVGLTITPLNSYPSGGHVMITLISGSVRDAAGNTINEDLVCEAHVQIYDDPYVKKFTVETKSLEFPDEFPMLDGVAAKKEGKITIEFNNPMYTPKRDETGTLPILVPISEDPTAENYIGKYVKLRVGALEAKLPSPDATVTSDIVSDDPFTFVVTGNAQGGITKIVATPKVNYASETWYFVDLEQLLQDENRVDLNTIDNNNFVDPHDIYSPNADNYFIQFRSEDTIAPKLRFVFEKIDNMVTPATSEWPYIAEVDEDDINCVSFDGFEGNGAPVGAIITEWSEMGFDNKDYYINTDPNGLRPYFKLKDSQGNELPFDVVVLRVYEPDATGSDPYRRDAVWFGFVPFEELKEGNMYTMEFMPTYQAPGSALAEGPVFVDDNGNALVADTYVSFLTCSPNMLPACMDPVITVATTNVAGKNTTANLTPGFTVTFDQDVNIDEPLSSMVFGAQRFTITGGGNTWKAYSQYNVNKFPSAIVNGKEVVTVPFTAFLDVVPVSGIMLWPPSWVYYTPPAMQLSEKTEYTITVDAGVFYNETFVSLTNCVKTAKFWTPDLTAPAANYLSPDKIVDTNNNLGQSPYAIDPRNPGRLIIGWNEDVTPQAGKLVEVWQNGTTKRLTFTIEQGTFVSDSNKWWVQLPADFLQYNSNFHVDVQEGFVKDLTGNISARLTGFEVGTDVLNGDGTWTFSTGADSNPTIIAWTPICMVEPGNMHTQPHGADSVKINNITITLSEKATPVAGKNLYVEFARGGATLRSWNVSSMTSTDQLTWTITPNPAFIVANNDDYIIYVEEGAFAQTYSANSLMSGTTPDYEGDNFLSCEIDGFDTVIPASFAFSDTSAPTARIWPENGNVKVPFNAHGYVRFTESLIAFNSIDQMLVVTQNNIKNWIKVWKYDATGANPTPLASDEYVVEFVNPERTHARITFHDPEAPSIDGYTYNLKDEWNYAIVVNAEGDNGFWLQDMVGNILFDDDASVTDGEKISKFTTEDITAPNFFVTTCNMEPEKVQIKITPWVNEDPYDNDRDYLAEAGKAYYVVRPAGTTVTAANLFNKTWSDVAEVNVPAGGVTVNWTLPAEIRDNYNYTVFAVMQDDETDLYVATAYNNAWVTTDPIFIASGDANPATGAIGIADIRPAPNKNMAVKTWNFCFCDDDQPLVVSKEWNQHMNVPVDETFEIEFNEFIQPGADVRLSGEGTGGTIMTPDYGYEVRLREWDNNVAVPVRIKGNGTGNLGLNGATGIIVTPGSDLDEETKYYIEIDRWVVWDVPGSNCLGNDDEVNVPESLFEGCTSCDTDDPYQNNFPGWIGRNEWWFKTTDNTAPILTAVSPLGSCVPVNNNQIVFTFQEKNEMVIKQLAGINTNSIYIYKEGSTIPYEVIPAASGAVVRTGTDTWTITYTTLHPYNSEEVYSVEWNKGIFVDNAIPVQHNYTESLSAVVDGQTSAWHKFSFTSEDNLKPVANWAFMNRLWVEEYDDENLAYPLAIGSYNSNDILAQPVDVCDMYQVPQFVGAYVWFNEPTALTAVTIASGESESSWKSRWMNENFYLTTPTGTISLKWISNGNTGGSPVTLPNGSGVVPANTDWYYIEFNGALASLGEFDFGIKAGKIKDVNATNCRVNTLDAIKLFNFCVWDATAPTAQLFDGQEVEILNVSANNYLETCVEEGTYFRLKFNKPVVKTSAIMMPPQFGNPVNPFWWTFDNLYLTVADLMDNGGPIYSFENADTDELVEIMAVEIVVPGQEYKIFPKNPLVSEDHYEFVINEDVLKDMVRIPNGNFFPGKTWEFIATDWEAPYVVTLFPADEAENISPVANLTITFNEEVSLGTSARIIIRDNGTNGLIYNFRADDSQHVTLSANRKVVTINHDGLNKNDMYYVQVEPGFVNDASCKFLPFEGKFEQGIVDDAWNFKTGDGDAPLAILWPTPGDDCVEIDANLVLRFDENINLTDKGKLVIYKVVEGGSFHNPLWPDAMFGDVVAVIPFTSWNDPQVRISGSDAANGLNRDIITVTPPAGLWESDATYYVRIVGDGVLNATEADVVVDDVGLSWEYPVAHSSLTLLPGIHHNQWHFTIGNNDEPVLVSMTPERGETVPAGVASAVTDLTMTFENEVAFGNGAIKVFEFIVAPDGGVAEQIANPWMEFNIPADVASGKVSLSADMKTVTVHDVALLDGITWYYVLVEPGAITSNIECTLRSWSGINNPDEWLFHTAPDVTDPVLEANAVTSDACSEVYLDPSNVAIELTFSEPVSVANGTGLVEIMEDDEVVASATITAAHIDGNVVTLSIEDFDNAIEDQKMYTIVIGGDAIHDRATASLTGTQNPFGLVPSGNENWYTGTEIVFHTGDFTAPVAINFEPNMVVDLENDVTLKVWFSEPVQSGTGKLILTDADSGQEWEFMAEDAVWSADMMMLSYEVELPDETSYFVTLEEGFVMDMVYMDSCDEPRYNVAVTDEDAWTFAIDDNTVPTIVEDLTEDVDNLMLSFHVVLQYDDIITYVDASKAILWFDGYPTSGGVTGAEIGTDPTTIIIHVTAPQDQAEYMLALGAGFVHDDAINANPSAADMTGPYYVGDRTAPILEDAGPEGILGSYIGVKVFVDFFDDSELTVVAPITIEDAEGEVEAVWTPELDEEQAASFMPELWFGTYTVIIPAGAVVDVNGNAFAGFTWSFAIIDNTAPDCMTIISPEDGENCVEGDIVLQMEFCERVAPGAVTKMVKVYDVLEIQGQLSTNELFYSTPVTEEMIDGEFVNIPVSGLADNTSYIVMIDADAIRDEAGNPYSGINDPVTWNFTTGDNTAPTVELVPTGNTNNKNEFVVEARFSEPVLGALDYIEVDNAITAVVAATADPKVYTITITAEDMETVTVTVPVTITDVNCNNNPLAAEVVEVYVVGDNTAPEVEVTDKPEDVLNTDGTFTVELTFTEEVTGVDEALEGSEGLVSVETEDGIVYVLTFTGADETELTLVLDKTKVTDVSENANQLVEGLSHTFMVGDHVDPTAVVDPLSGDDLRVAVLEVTVTFSEEVIVPEIGGIVVTGGDAVIDNDGPVYTVAITAEDGADVTLELTNLITDDSYNANKLAPAVYHYNFGDRTAPVVTADPATLMDAPNTFDVIIYFNEPVTGVNASTVLVDGKRASLTMSTIVAGQAYKLTLTGADGDHLTLTLTDGIADLSGNALVQTSFEYHVADVVAPTVVANPATGTNLPNENVVTLTFSEDVLNVVEDVEVTGAVTYEVVMTGDSVYTVTYTADDYAEVAITVPATVTDLSGNAIVPVTFDYTIGDHVAPTATVVPDMNDNAPNEWNVVITFSEAVVVPEGAISVTGADYEVKEPVGNVYTVTITGEDHADVVLSLSTAIEDASENGNPFAGAVYNYTIGDNTKPVAVVTPASNNNAPNTWKVTVTFSEPVIVPEGAISVTGATSSYEVDPNGLVYTVDITGVDGAEVALTLSSDITDTSVNANELAAATYNYTIGDHVAPTATVVPSSATNAPGTWDVVITFSEPVIVPAGAITVTGATSYTVTPDGNVYTVAITGEDHAEVTLSLSAAIKDASENGNPFAGAVYNYTIGDNTKPVVTVNPATLTNAANAFTVTITFSEAVTGVNTSNVTVTGGTMQLDTLVAGLAYTATITAADNADVVLTFSDAIKDLAGNTLGVQTFNYKIGCNSPEVRSTAITTFVGEEVAFTDAAAGIDTMLVAGVHVFTYTMPNGCSGTLTVTVTSIVRQVAIAAIQGTSMTSPVVGATRGITGTVTGVVPGAGYFVQDANAAWSGIWVADATTVVAEGNGVHVEGVVNEVNGVTTLTGTGSVVNPPLAIVPIVLASPELAKDEQYESVNVQVKGVRANAASPDGTWDVYTETTNVLTIGKWMYTYTPVAGNFYNVTGIVNGANDLFKLEPRKMADVVDLLTTDITVIDAIEFKVYPNPFNNELNIDNYDKLTRVTLTNIAGQRVIDVQYPERVIRTANLVSGVYVVTLFNENGIVKSERIVKR